MRVHMGRVEISLEVPVLILISPLLMLQEHQVSPQVLPTLSLHQVLPVPPGPASLPPLLQEGLSRSLKSTNILSPEPCLRAI